ncbi:PfkB family carbohydrate kinase [Pseudoduganella ginsengisoli]|uniref:Adenylyltransferase/cytidyltransferase family protein n=1 Tax=Pseudoduganella ginsengisoli TaxID=1462440 RepID=A0A6L6PZ57_9BURK|nr:PfkB family carbohydrate kinase [Pseudoduganella ginsengisoli]MTW02650.1 adenylyltransferase/cytidyltransferase family protein [Pseudoduganella ginsengisoli]
MSEKTVLVTGNFNVLHPGHLRLLRFASECGTRLIVAVASDRIAGKAAHVPEALRLESVQSIAQVNESFIMDEPAAELVARLRPDIVVKGKEHETADNPELPVLESYGGRLLFSSGESWFSSSDLLNKEIEPANFNPIGLPHDYLGRHNISLARLRELVRKFSTCKVCVVGDLIIDEYITCEPLGMSREDPTIVVSPIDTTRFVGGAGIVAAHAAGMGAKAEFVSLTGADAVRQYALDELQRMNVNAHMLTDDSRPTTLKQRYRCHGKSMLRVSHLRQDAISTQLQEDLVALMEQAMEGANVLVFSDFNYGLLPQPVVDRITAMAKAKGILLAADSQSSSQVGDISRFHGMDLITPTEHEARLGARNMDAGLVVLAEQLRGMADARNVLLKMGGDGMLVHIGDVPGTPWVTDRISALNVAPRDVAGAGDSLLIASALALASGADIWEAACLGSLAAAVQVGRVGNVPIQTEELLKELTA